MEERPTEFGPRLSVIARFCIFHCQFSIAAVPPYLAALIWAATLARSSTTKLWMRD